MLLGSGERWPVVEEAGGSCRKLLFADAVHLEKVDLGLNLRQFSFKLLPALGRRAVNLGEAVARDLVLHIELQDMI